MPTTITKAVKSSPGPGEYSTLSGYEAGEQGNLITADEIRRAECWNISDTTAVTWFGWTTDATRYVEVFAKDAHLSTGGITTNAYRMDVASAIPFRVTNVDHMKVRGIQIKKTSTSTSCMEFGDGSLSWAELDKIICRGEATSGANIGIWMHDEGTFTVRNCVGVGRSGGATSSTHAGFYAGDAGVTVNCYNCVGLDLRTGSVSNGGAFFNITSSDAFNVYNCYGHRANTSNKAYVNIDTMETSAASDDSGSSAALDNVAFSTVNFISVTEASLDLHLKEGSGLIDVGTNKSPTITDDLAGDTRTGAWDLGVFAAEGGGVGPVALSNYRRRRAGS